MTSHIITLCGPSLSGKTELSKILQSLNCHTIVSFTTRPQRANEVNGVDYRFISVQEFKKLNFIQKTHYNNFYYGVSEQDVIDNANKPIVWVVAPSSLSQIKSYCLKNNHNLTKIFISNPEEVLLSRLFERFKNDNQAKTSVYVARLQSMINHERQWIADAKSNVHNYDLVINHFDSTTQADVLKQVIDKINEKTPGIKIPAKCKL